MEACVFQREGGERLKIKDLDEGFQDGLRELKAGVEGLISSVLDIVEYMSVLRSLRRGSTTEVLNRVLDTLVIDVNNRWRNKEVGIGGGQGLIMVMTYTQV